jgi:predicted XRE-type DNA-binding protein
MTLGADARDKLVKAIRTRIEQSGLNSTEIAQKSGVHQSQVSRICRGEFKTASFNVMQICKFLGIDGDVAEGFTPTGDFNQKRIESGAIAIWDRTPEDAERIVRLLKDLANFRHNGTIK